MSISPQPADTAPDPRPDYLVVFEQFWRDIVAPDGTLDLDAVARELFDFRRCMDAYSTVLCHATLGVLSKPNTDGYAACSEIDDRQETYFREALADEIDEAAEEAATTSRDFGRGFKEAARLIRRQPKEAPCG